MESWQFLKTIRGLRLVNSRGYTYVKDHQFGNKCYWRCDYRPWKCKARASSIGHYSSGDFTTKSQVTFNSVSHGHAPQLKRKSAKVEQNSDSEFTERSTDEIIQPKSNSLLKSAQKAQAKTMNSSNSSNNSDSEMCLRWNSHHSNMQTVFPNLLRNERYVDVTLAAEGQLIKCHRLVLSSCSEYFDNILKDTYPMQHTVIYLRDIQFWVVKALVDFMYKGEVNIDQMKLEPLLKAAEDLQIKGLAGQSKTNNETEDKPMQPEQKPNKESIEKKIKKEIDNNYNEMNDDDDDDYTPSHYKKKVQPKKLRKRKIATPPDPSSLKHVKINLKGTKSRPNIKQPKFYDPDYPEYDPDRCVSPQKLDSSDPIFNLDNIKMEPIDFDVPKSPTYAEISSLMDQTLSECATLEKLKAEKNKSPDVKTVEEPKKIRKYAGKTGISVKTNFPPDKQIFLQTSASIDLPSEIRNKNSDPDIKPVIINKINDQDKLAEKFIKDEPKKTLTTDVGLNKNTVILNVQKNADGTSIKKIIDIAKPNLTEGNKQSFSQIRVRNLTTTDNVLKKFATTQLTSILKKDSNVPTILRRVSSPKPAILRHAKKIEIIKASNSEIADKLSALAKTKKELTCVEDSKKQDEIITTDKQSDSQNTEKTPEKLSNTLVHNAKKEN